MCTGAEGVQIAIPDPPCQLFCPVSPWSSRLKREIHLIMDVALDGLRENSICTFAVCSARYKTRPGLVYHYGHSHSTSSGDPAKELSPSPAEVEPRSVADTAASNQPGWSQNQLSFLTLLQLRVPISFPSRLPTSRPIPTPSILPSPFTRHHLQSCPGHAITYPRNSPEITNWIYTYLLFTCTANACIANKVSWYFPSNLYSKICVYVKFMHFSSLIILR